jgi:hypothetical protein
MKRIYLKDRKPPESETVLCVQLLNDQGQLHYRYITGYYIEEEGFYDVLNEEGVEDVVWWYELEPIKENGEKV